MIILTDGLYFCGGKLYRAGDVLTDDADTRALILAGKAEERGSKKETREPEPLPELPDAAEAPEAEKAVRKAAKK